MHLYLRNVKVVNVDSPYHEQIVSIEIEKGSIKNIGKRISPSTRNVIDGNGLIATPGFFDLSSSFNDPGNEHKEDISSGSSCAEDGGFTHVCIQPDTDPVIDSKSGVEYILSKASERTTCVLPYGSISKKNENQSLADLLELREGGVVAFSSGLSTITNPELLLNALRYTANFGGLIITRPQDQDLSKFGQMHEGIVSTQLGLKGISDISETIMVKRDLDIVEYTGGRLHFAGISSGQSLDLIGKAKKGGANVTCDVSIHNLLYTDDQLVEFDTNYKVNPPLRSEANRKALVKGLKNGTIDAIVTDHQPQDIESKKLEFDLAEFGMIGLQTALPGILKLSQEVDISLLVHKLTNGPRVILGFDPIKIEKGEKADITLIDPKRKWIFDESTNLSKSTNSPLFHEELTGKSVGIINGLKNYLPKN